MSAGGDVDWGSFVPSGVVGGVTGGGAFASVEVEGADVTSAFVSAGGSSLHAGTEARQIAVTRAHGRFTARTVPLLAGPALAFAAMSWVHEVLLAVSRTLEREYIDEDFQEITVGHNDNRTVENHTIHVRGVHDGVPVVLTYQKYYSPPDGATFLASYWGHMLEIFVADPSLAFEGSCRRRGAFDGVARWFGGGGLKGEHPIFTTCRIDGDVVGNRAAFADPAFCERLAALVEMPTCHGAQLQANTGIYAMFDAADALSSEPRALELLHRCAALVSR